MLVNAYATHRDPPALDFPHEARARRDRSDPELAPHLDGFMGFVMGRNTRPMTAIRYGVLRHLQRVRHHLAFEVEPAQLPALASWARAANAILFVDDGTVRAPDHKVLVDPETGDPEPDAALPYPADAMARKTATDHQLASRNISVPSHLPACTSEVEVELRAPHEVARRILTLFVCAVRAEGLATNDPLPVATMQKRMPLGFEALSPREQAFMTSEEPSRQDVVTHAWSYEAIVPLAWSLGLLDLPFPAAICDVPLLAKTLLELDADRFVASASLRPVAEILDALDLTFRLHWWAVDARAKQRPLDGVEPGAVLERHRALNWLTRFTESDWDDVTTPT